MPIVRQTDDFIVNTTTDSIQLSPALAHLGDGRFAVSWHSFDTGEVVVGNRGTTVRMRIIESDGTVTGPDIIANTTQQSNQADTAVAATDSGFAMVWRSEDDGDESSSCIRIRYFSGSSNADGNDFVINTTTQFAQTKPDITTLNDGRQLVAWVSQDAQGSDASDGKIRFRLFDHDGTSSTDDMVANTTVISNQIEPSVTALANGGFVISWTSTDAGDGSAPCVRARIFDADGDPTGNDFIVNGAGDGIQANPSFVTLDNGSLLAIWQSGDSSEGVNNGSGIRGRLFSSSGDALGADFSINSTRFLNQEFPSAARLSDGHVAVVWQSDDNGDGSGTCIRARILSPDGKPMASDFIVNTTSDTMQYNPVVAAGPDGTFTVAWTSYDTGDGSPSLIRAVSFNARSFLGDSGDDSWTGGSESDTMDGFAGNDSFFGLQGADVLSGGSGNDKLYGGLGADKLDGGDGLDFCSYSLDAPVTAALDGSFTNTGAAAGDIYVSIEGLSGSNAGSDTLAGNAFNNTIYGNGGSDIIYGRAGNDVIYGGDGNDKFRGDSGGDRLDGGAGNDTAYYYTDIQVTVALDGSLTNTGTAAGDTFFSIENLAGSATGADVLSGNAFNNYLSGYGGNDTLLGRDGHDKLNGGAGGDYLSGGAGYDAYIYYSASEGGDTIANFSAADSLQFYGVRFGGLSAGALASSRFVARNDTLAQTADQRFIYNKVTDTLWYDSNGSGAGGLTKMLTLVGDYNMTAADFWII